MSLLQGTVNHLCRRVDKLEQRLKALEAEPTCDCYHDGPNCRAQSSSRLMCTLPAGHEGPHVACGSGDEKHRLETWGPGPKCDCDHGGDNCSHRGPNGFVCTKRRGHEGPHVACNTRTHNLESWGQDSDVPHLGLTATSEDIEISRLKKWLLDSQEKLRTARYDKQEVEAKLQAELDKVKADLKRETENHNNTFELLKEERRKAESMRMTSCLQPKRPRFHLEVRSGIWAIYDMEHPEYQDSPGCQADYPYVVASWFGERVDDEKGHLQHWEMPEWKQRQAERLLAILNGGEE